MLSKVLTKVYSFLSGFVAVVVVFSPRSLVSFNNVFVFILFFPKRAHNEHLEEGDSFCTSADKVQTAGTETLTSVASSCVSSQPCLISCRPRAVEWPCKAY